MSRQRTGYDRDNRNSDSGRYGRSPRDENYGNYGGRRQDDDYDYDDSGRRYRNRQDDDYEDAYDDNRSGYGRQGFASMDPRRQRAIAAKGGRHSHDNDDYDDSGRRYRSRQDDDYEDAYDDNRSGRGRQGFASMDPRRQRAIAAKGGRHSHDNDDDRRSDDEDDYDYYDEYDDYGDDYDEEEEDNRGHRRSGDSRGHQPRNPDGTFASTSRSGRRSSHDGGTSERGFASMSKSEVRRIAAMGGRASHGGHSGSRSSRHGR